MPDSVIGTFARDGLTKDAYSPGEAVELRFAGWHPVTASTETAGPPPKGGPGSAPDAWAQYARDHDVELDDDATREDIIAALTKHDVPTE